MAKQFSGEAEIEMEVETSVKAEIVTKVEAEGENMIGTAIGDKIKAGVQGEVEPKFTKEQILNSKKYSNSMDILSALLTEGESYTHSEVCRITEEFLKGEIK